MTKRNIFKAHQERLRAAGLLVLRLAAGGLMLSHGIPKLMKWGTLSDRFPDPFGVGSPASLALAIFAEVGCSALLVVGLFTRLATVPLMVTMLVAALMIHGDDPWSKKELAVVYLLMYATLAMTGPGRFSLDARRKTD